MTVLTRSAIAGCVLLLLAALDLGRSVPALVPAGNDAPPGGGHAPEQPRATVDTTFPRTSGRTIHVPAGADLQEAIDAAEGGDRIALEPRAIYRGPFRLRRKGGQGWIVITSAASTLPPPGRRVGPAHAALMPRLVAAAGPVLLADPGAHHYRVVGLEIAPAEGTFLKTVVQLGDDESRVEELPHHLVFDRCYVRGDPQRGARRGIAMNSRETAVVDSYLSDFKEAGADTQALAGWNGPGPFTIANNYLEAAGENVMFGGADAAIAGLVPADISVLRNHVAKPLRWKRGHEAFEGVEWTVKNLLELKNARRVLIEGNLFEHNWPQAQNGFAILFTVRNQDGGAPWSTVEDVTFVNNLVRHVAAGVNVLGRDDNHPSQRAQRIAIRNNLFLDVGGRWRNGRLFQLLNGTNAVSIEHNTALHTGSLLVGGDTAPHTRFTFENNIAPHNEHGITGSDTEPGWPTLRRYFPDAVVRRNVIVGGSAAHYPKDNFFPPSFDALGRLSIGRNAFQLTLARPYAGAGTDGRDPGADATAVARALAGIVPVGLRVHEADTTGRTSSPSQPAAAGADARHRPPGAGGPGAGSVARIVFWTALILLGYVYVGYPALSLVRAAVRPRPRRIAAIAPSVSVVVIAHNEQDRIRARIENLLELDYPADRLAIIVASDGSTDETVARARRYEGAGVTVRAFGERRGKPAVINDVVPAARGDIIVFADARQRFDRGSVRALVANFADPAVGAVSGELMLTTAPGTATAARGVALYWRYEKLIRSTEARAHSTVGATGAIYAIRRDLFEPIPDNTILDDVLIPLRIVRRGHRVLFEPHARAYDGASATAAQEFVRKARTSAGMFQLFAREPWLLNPFRNPLWFETVSHKALRLALPLLHAALLAANAALAHEWLYGVILAGQVTFYGAAAAGFAQRNLHRRSVVCSVPCAVCLHSWVTLVGFVRFMTGRQPVTWDRESSPAAALRTGTYHRDTETPSVA